MNDENYYNTNQNRNSLFLAHLLDIVEFDLKYVIFSKRQTLKVKLNERS